MVCLPRVVCKFIYEDFKPSKKKIGGFFISNNRSYPASSKKEKAIPTRRNGFQSFFL
jgi:hypothetical protein